MVLDEDNVAEGGLNDGLKMSFPHPCSVSALDVEVGRATYSSTSDASGWSYNDVNGRFLW